VSASAIQKHPGSIPCGVDSVLRNGRATGADIRPRSRCGMMTRSFSIRQSVADVGIPAIAVALVILVIFLFLRSASATFIRGARGSGSRLLGYLRGDGNAQSYYSSTT